MSRGKDFNFRQYQKHLDREEKKRGEFGYGRAGYGNPLRVGERYLIEAETRNYILHVTDRRKDRQQRCWFYKADIQKFTIPASEEDDGRWYMSSWNYWYDDLRDGKEIKHDNICRYNIKILTDTTYAKLLLVYDMEEELSYD